MALEAWVEFNYNCSFIAKEWTQDSETQSEIEKLQNQTMPTDKELKQEISTITTDLETHITISQERRNKRKKWCISPDKQKTSEEFQKFDDSFVEVLRY